MEIKEGYTRVTSVLSQWDKSSHIDPAIYERKTYLGTRVHAAIANFFLGIPSMLDDDEGGKYFSSFLLWHRKYNPVLLESETRLYDHERMLTGAMDALMKFEGSDEIFLIDWKTSYNPDKQNWPLQASFYMSLLEKSGTSGVCRAKFVKLDKFGDMPREFEYAQSEYLIEGQDHALWTYKYNLPWIEKRKNQDEERVE